MTAFRVTEQMLVVLDDYLHNRGKFEGSDEEGHKGLQYVFPQLTKEQREKAIRKWRRESKKAEGLR